jgi:hypothetical protein
MDYLNKMYTINVTSSDNTSVAITSIPYPFLFYNESIHRIDKLLTAAFDSYKAGVVHTVTIRQLLQLAALFDTLHDFGKYSTCYDTLSGGRGQTAIAEYKILRMRFSALSKLVFNIGSDRLSRGYGSLRTPAQVYTSALTAKTLEADFLEFARKYREAAKTGEFISSNRGTDYGSIMTKLKDNGYGFDGTTSGKVCLLVDTQKMLYKWSTFSDYCIVAILRESVYDAAGKLLISDTTGKNVHVETGRLGGVNTSGDYTYSSADDSNDFVGNIPVALGPIDNNDNYKSYNITARIGVGAPIEVQGNSGAKHPNSILMLNKNIDGAANATCATIVDGFINPNSTSVNNPYNEYVPSAKNTTGGTGCPSFASNNANFTQKRTGDGNQACICKRINTGKVQITARKRDDKTITIQKIVLVTIDRMLYAIALLLNIPVIYEHPTEGAAYIPNANTDLVMGGGNSAMNDGGNTSMNDIQPNQLNIPKTPTIYQRGGANLTLATTGIFSQPMPQGSSRTQQNLADKNMAIYILENPVYMLALTPFIRNVAYNDSTSNFKTAIESILALDYTTFVNKSPEPIIPSRSRINPSPHITNPAYTTYLRKVITKNTNMDTLIGPQYTQDNTDNNTDIKIIYLSYTPAIYNIRGSTYTLIYKYGHTGDTYNNDSTGRNLYIMNGNKALSPTSISDQFGVATIIELFRNGTPIDSESSEKIEEMLGELLAINTDTVENGFSVMGTVYSWTQPVLPVLAFGVVATSVYQQFFNRGSDVPLGADDPQLGGKVSPLSDSSINSSVEPDAAEPAEDDSSINSSVDSSIKSSEQDDDDSKQSEEKYPLLTKNDNYYAVAFNYTQTHKIIRDHGVNLPFYDDLCNVFTMFSYLWLFNKYVINVCIDDEETAIAYDQWSVKGKAQSVTSEAESVAGEAESVTSEAESVTSEAESVTSEAESVTSESESVTSDSRTVLIPTHKSLYILFNKMADIIKKEGTLPFLLTDLEQVLFDEKDYMYFQLQQIKRYVLRDDFIEVVEEKVDEPTVGKPSVDTPSVDTPSVDTPSVDTPSVDTPSVDTPSVDEPPVGKEIILKFIKEANDEEQTVNTELSRLSETDNFDDLLKYAIDRNLTRYGMFYMYSDYLTYISTLSMKKSTPSDSNKSSTVDNSIKSTTLDNSNESSLVDNSNESSLVDNSNESSLVDNSNESSSIDNSIYSNSKSSSLDKNSKSSSFDKNSKSSSFDKNSKSSSLDNSIDNNSTSSSVSSAILSRGGIHKKKSSKINRKTKVHRVTKNNRKVSESRKSKNKQRSKRKLLAKKKRGTRKNNRKNRK